MMDGALESQTFVEELRWCISQLELGLQRQSPDSRQAAESIKVLQILKSKKAPMVKKRQAMRNAFGDYRKKMKEAEKKSLSGLRHSRFQPLGVMKAPVTSRFLKMSHNKQQHEELVRGDLDKNLSNLHLQSSKLEPSTSTSPEAAEFTANLDDELVSQPPHGSVESTESSSGPYLRNNTSFASAHNDQFADKESTHSSSQGDKLPCISVSLKESSNSGHAAQSSSYHSSSPQASTSSCFGSNTMGKPSNSFRYEPSDNSFIFRFESPKDSRNEGQQEAVHKNDELSGSDMTIVLKEKGDEKVFANIYKYEKSINDFCFNFDEPGEESKI